MNVIRENQIFYTKIILRLFRVEVAWRNKLSRCGEINGKVKIRYTSIIYKAITVLYSVLTSLINEDIVCDTVFVSFNKEPIIKDIRENTQIDIYDTNSKLWDVIVGKLSFVSFDLLYLLIHSPKNKINAKFRKILIYLVILWLRINYKKLLKKKILCKAGLSGSAINIGKSILYCRYQSDRIPAWTHEV